MRAHHRVLKDIVRHFGCRRYLEIGVNEGESLHAVLQVHHPSTLVLCDNWGKDYGGRGKKNHLHIKHQLEEFEYQGEVIYFDGDSKETVPGLDRDVYSFDLILVDADHSAKGAAVDLDNAWFYLTPGGFLVFDDIIHVSHRYLLGVGFDFLRKTEDAELFYMDRITGNGAIAFRKTLKGEQPQWR